MNESTARLRNEIHRINADLAVLDEARTELLAALAEQPESTEVQEQLDRLENIDIASRKRQVERLQSMIIAASKIDERAVQEASEQRKREANDHHIDCLEKRAELTREFVEAWPRVVELLVEIGTLTDEARAAGNDAGLYRPQDNVDRFLEATGAHMAMSLNAAGLGGGRLGYITAGYSPFMKDWDPVEFTAQERADRARARRDAQRGGDRHAQ